MTTGKPLSPAAVLMLLGAAVLLVVLFWHYLLVVGVGAAAWRRLYPSRRRRPKSSWSSLGRTAALMYAAYNSRWLKPPRGVVNVRASVPASADGEPNPAELEEGEPDGIPY